MPDTHRCLIEMLRLRPRDNETVKKMRTRVWAIFVGSTMEDTGGFVVGPHAIVMIEHT